MIAFVSILAALLEVGTGLLLLAVPQLFARLLLGAEVTGARVVVSRVCGLGLLSLRVTWWPDAQTIRGMLLYNASVAAYLLYLAVAGEFRGFLLVPALLVHAFLTVLLVAQRASQNQEKTKESGQSS
jgi:hypothetical protein